MAEGIDRRTFAGALSAFAALGFRPGAARSDAADTLALGESQPFSFAGLQEMAQELAARPYVAPKRVAPEIIEQIDYDTWGKIHFRTQDAIFAEGPGRFPVTFFHLGQFFQKPVEMHLVEGEHARRVLYAPSAFDMPTDAAARQLPNDVGFAGLRFQEAREGPLDWRKNDWAAFLGASYFRAIGELHQYGLSALGIALDTAVADRDEEFPDFVRFYIGAQHDDAVTLHALLDGPGITGAYSFKMKRAKAVTMDIACSLFLRRDVSRLGIAPLTSMYWFSETSKPFAVDWRPEVHVSDGLAIWTGAGQRLWRPLNNPPHAMVSAFADENPNVAEKFFSGKQTATTVRSVAHTLQQDLEFMRVRIQVRFSNC